MNCAELGVPNPIDPGAAKVAPFKLEALRLGTLVVLLTTKGAVPVAMVKVSWPDNVGDALQLGAALVVPTRICPVSPAKVLPGRPPLL